MNILMIADPHIPVPPVNYGGIERNVDLMSRGLVKRGHRVHLMAGPGSRDYGGGLTLHRAPSLAYASRAFRKSWFQVIAYRAAATADIVVNHGRLDYLEGLFRTSKPMVHWFHNPLRGDEVSYVLSRRRRGDLFVAISQAQISTEAQAERFRVVYNPVDTETIPFSPVAANPPYALFLGRLTFNKGVHLAIEAARGAGIKLVIGGNVPNERGAADFFETHVKPFLGPQCEWVGPYDDALRAKLIGGASALLFPIQWNEPFGLVMIEAMAGGVPVIAWRRASTPEIVEHGRTGFLCDSVEEMVLAIRNIGKISRHACRAAAELRFSEPAFMRRVEELLSRVVPVDRRAKAGQRLASFP